MKFGLRALIVASLLAGSLPWMASLSYAVQVPRTLNALVAFGAGARWDVRSGAAERPRAIFSGSGRLGLQVPSQLQIPKAPASRTALVSAARKLPFAATDLGVIWRGSGRAPSIQTSRDGRSWTPWRQVHDSADMFDGETATHFSDLEAGHGARWVRVSVRSALQAASLKMAVINTSDGPRRTVRLTREASAATGQPNVTPRAAWGADESVRKGSPNFTRVKKIFLHHTVIHNNADPAGGLRAIYSYHVQNRGFTDIAYNYLIDARGVIYEGRSAGQHAPGRAALGEDPNGSAAVGAHTQGYNVGSLGIALLADTNRAAPASRALDSLVGLSAWAADRHGIDPLGKDPGGGPDSPANIAGHKDSPSSNTECPGAGLYRAIPSIRQRVEETIAAQTGLGPPSMPTGTQMTTADNPADPTPNAGGDVSRTAVRVEVAFDKEGGGQRKVSVPVKGGSYNLVDASYGGKRLAPGSYSVSAVAFDAQGRASTPAPVAQGYPVHPPPPSGLERLIPPLDTVPDSGNGLAHALRTVVKALGL